MSTEDHFIDGALLLCVDMQPVFINAIVEGPRVLRRCQFAVEAASGIGLRTAFTEQVPQKLGGTAPELLAVAGRKSPSSARKPSPRSTTMASAMRCARSMSSM